MTSGASLTHVVTELRRLDLLVRVQAWRVRAAHGDDLDPDGLVMADAQAGGPLDRPLGSPPWATVTLTEEMRTAVQGELDALAADAAGQEQAAAAAGVTLRLPRLAELFGLSRFDVDVVLACLAPELDPRYARLYGHLHDDVTRRRPSVDLALMLFAPDLPGRVVARTRFAPDAPLRRARLVELGTEPEHPGSALLNRTLELDPRIAAHLLGDDGLDERLRTVATLLDPADADDPGSAAPPDDVASALAEITAHTDGTRLAFLIHGDDPAARRGAAVELARLHGRRLLAVDGAAAARLTEEPARLVGLADRDARLVGALLFWDGIDTRHDAGPDAPSHLQHEAALEQVREALLDAAADRSEPTLLGGTTAWEPPQPRPGTRFLRLGLAPLGHAERLRLWRTALGDAATGLDLEGVAGLFRLGAGRIAAAAATARNLALTRTPAHPVVTDDDLRAACRLHSRRHLATLARAVTPRATWNDLVLPADGKEQLRELADQIRHRALVNDTWGFATSPVRGRGVTVLFAGPPGTGKTMAAEVIANTLGLDLYTIDLSGVVSKYIGETEKNLARLFADAAMSHAILFFDEADALFGRRSAVHDAHDRYANIEISYLLQQLEDYDGVVVLATNLRKNMDEAFVRRLHATVEFPIPGIAERLRIWQRIWPASAPLDPDVDLQELARTVEVTGGNIRNIALSGAFLAAADGGTVTMEHLRRATQREYQKMGKVRHRGPS